MTRTPLYKIKIKADINPFNLSPLPDPEGTVLLMANQGAYFVEIEKVEETATAPQKIDGDKLLCWLKEWKDSINALHRDPIVEEETLELIIARIEQEMEGGRNDASL